MRPPSSWGVSTFSAYSCKTKSLGSPAFISESPGMLQPQFSFPKRESFVEQMRSNLGRLSCKASYESQNELLLCSDVFSCMIQHAKHPDCVLFMYVYDREQQMCLDHQQIFKRCLFENIRIGRSFVSIKHNHIDSLYKPLEYSIYQLLPLPPADSYSHYKFEMKAASKAPTLQLEILTWEKDSHGLFDYEATKHVKEYFEIQGPCKLFRNWHQAQTVLVANDKIKRGMLPEETFHFLSSIALRHNGNNENFLLHPPERPSQEVLKRDGNPDETGPMNTHAYVAVRYYKGGHRSDGYPLSLGNVVKLGRVEYRVVEIGGIKKQEQRRDLFLGQFNGVHQATEAIAGNCKFCLCDDNTPDNFLISPCKCKGSCEGVHVQCLKMWIDSKVKKEVTGMVVSYNFTKFQCEICKEPFPRMVTRPASGFAMEMITIEKPKTPYVILEGINERKESKEQRCLHVICPENKNTVKIGRGHQCQIRLQDISVSRMHSQIKFQAGDFYVNDLNSKFGTLVRLDKTVELSSKVKLQVGRSLYKFQVE